MSEKSTADALARERQHHDEWAADIDLDKVLVRESFEASTAPENRFIVKNLGNLKGKKLLDLGCGAGENSVYFALQGANCVATDYSPGMLETAQLLARKYQVEIETKCINAEEIEFPDNSFDCVYAANLLHHVRPETALQEMHRVCKPGGKVCFWDPLRHNPVINIYRRMASKVRSEDEMPLSVDFVKNVEALFSQVSYETFWFSTLWIFLRFYLIEGVSPNQERYWKKIIYEEPRLRSTYSRLEKLDKYLKKIPLVERYAWNIAVVATK